MREAAHKYGTLRKSPCLRWLAALMPSAQKSINLLRKQSSLTALGLAPWHERARSLSECMDAAEQWEPDEARLMFGFVSEFLSAGGTVERLRRRCRRWCRRPCP